jgi:hypothetical protein
LAAIIVISTPVPAAASLPSGASRVPVTAGSVTSGIDAHLRGAASIEGTITAVAGGVISATVIAYLDGAPVRAAVTSGAGHYFLGGLIASSSGYAVCVNGSSVSGGNSTTGYLGRCWKTALFKGTTVPAGADKVPLTNGQHETGIDIAMPSAAAIAGKVVNGSGSGIPSTKVIAKNIADGSTFIGLTLDDGTYRIRGLTPSAGGYRVCADPSLTTMGPTGFRPRCFQDVPWNGGAIPPGAKAVSITAGQTHSGVNIRLLRGAAIAGTVNAAGSGQPLAHIGVAAFSSAGNVLGRAATDSGGHYKIRGLPESTSIHVCASTRFTTGTNYPGECWKEKSWNGQDLPAGMTDVATTVGATHTGIAFTLQALFVPSSSIAGRVIEQAGSEPLQGALVSLFTSTDGTPLRTTATDANGHFKFDDLFGSSSGYRVCARATTETTRSSGTPTGGWAPRCYVDGAWDGASAPVNATKVPLMAGENRTGVKVTLRRGGGVSGTVFKFRLHGAARLGNIPVFVFKPNGKRLGATISSHADGTYSITNLPPSADGYIVCFDGRAASAGTAGYLPRCWEEQAWNGVP